MRLRFAARTEVLSTGVEELTAGIALVAVCVIHAGDALVVALGSANCTGQTLLRARLKLTEVVTADAAENFTLADAFRTAGAHGAVGVAQALNARRLTVAEARAAL